MRKFFLAAILLGGAVCFLCMKRRALSKPPIAYPVFENKPFVIVIPTFNDETTIEHTLFSVCQQQYEHYRILIIDDHSLDKTIEKAQHCLQYFHAENRATLVKNRQSCGTLGCLYNGIHSCGDREIAVILLGGDQLASPHVLQTLNRCYANPSTWMTYGSSLQLPTFEQAQAKIKAPFSKGRTHGLRSHPRGLCNLPITFYAALFTEIPLKDLFHRGGFYTMGWELAIGMPLLEMAAKHAEEIDTPLYLANRESDQRDRHLHPKFFQSCQQHVCSRPCYRPLSQLSYRRDWTGDKADIVLFSHDNPTHLFALLESINKQVEGVDEIIVYYLSSTQAIETGYLEVQVAFPQVTFVHSAKPFKAELLSRALSPTFSSSPYIILARDGVIISDRIHLGNCIQSLEQTQAYGIYFDLHSDLTYCSELSRYEPTPPATSLEGISPNQQLRAWQISKGRDDWNNRGSFHFALFRKADLAAQFNPLPFSSPEELLRAWNWDLCGEVGLFYHRPKAISLQISQYPQSDLEKFLSGLKIDLTPLFQLQPTQRDLPIEPTFVLRYPMKTATQPRDDTHCQNKR